MPAPHSPGAPSAQAGLTFASELLGLFQLGSPELLLSEGGGGGHCTKKLWPCPMSVWEGGVWGWVAADTQPKAVEVFYGYMMGFSLILALDHLAVLSCWACPRWTECQSPSLE